MTIQELAQRLNIQPQSLYRYIRNGKLKARKVGQAWQIDKDDAETFIANYSNKKRGFADPSHPHHGKGKTPDPHSLTSLGYFSHIYLPCHKDEAKRLNRALTAQERLEVLKTFAELKNKGKDILLALSNIV